MLYHNQPWEIEYVGSHASLHQQIWKRRILSQYLVYMSENNLAISIQSAARLAEAIYRKPGNSNTTLGEHWITRYQQRYKELWSKLSENWSSSDNCSRYRLFKGLFCKGKEYICEISYPDDEKYILDEKGGCWLLVKGTWLHAVYQDTNRKIP